MGVQFASRRVVEAMRAPESPIEAAMAVLLESGPSTSVTAAFAVVDTWRHALEAVRESPWLFERHSAVVFPQVGVSSYRPDYLVVTAASWRERRYQAFFVECDGLEFHSVEHGFLAEDIARQAAIARITGLDMLRFGGAEILHSADMVEEVVAAQIRTMQTVRAFGADAFEARLLGEIRSLITALSCHPSMRHPYWMRNRPLPDEDDEVADPCGDVSNDPFMALRSCMGRLLRAVRDRISDDAECQQGHPLSIGDVLPGTLLGIGRRAGLAIGS